MRGYPSFAAAAAATGLTTGTSVWVGGNAAMGDSGAGWFGYKSASVLTPSINVIQIAAGGQLLRLTSDQATYAAQLAAAIGTNLRAGAGIPSALDYDTSGDPMPNGMAAAYGRSGGLLMTVTKTDGVDSWIKSYTYTGSDVNGNSGWVKQS